MKTFETRILSGSYIVISKGDFASVRSLSAAGNPAAHQTGTMEVAIFHVD